MRFETRCCGSIGYKGIWFLPLCCIRGLKIIQFEHLGDNCASNSGVLDANTTSVLPFFWFVCLFVCLFLSLFLSFFLSFFHSFFLSFFLSFFSFFSYICYQLCGQKSKKEKSWRLSVIFASINLFWLSNSWTDKLSAALDRTTHHVDVVKRVGAPIPNLAPQRFLSSLHAAQYGLLFTPTGPLPSGITLTLALGTMFHAEKAQFLAISLQSKYAIQQYLNKFIYQSKVQLRLHAVK